MIDLGFEDQVTNILTKVDINADSAVNRQTLMFTATMTPVIEKLQQDTCKACLCNHWG